MKYDYFIEYSDGTVEKNVYPLTEQYVYKALGTAISDYLKYHKGVAVVWAKVIDHIEAK